MSDFVPVEKGVPIRFPSTANLLIDSVDRYGYGSDSTSGSFTIQKNQSILNGFFSRIAPTEVTLNWAVPNVYDISGTNPTQGGLYFPANVRVDISGSSITNVKIPVGLYTIGDALDTIVRQLNAASLGATFSITRVGNAVNLVSTVGYRFPLGTTANKNGLVTNLGFNLGGGYVTTKTIYSNQPAISEEPGSGGGFTIDGTESYTSLVEYQYLDFVSNQLTYNQELKDSSTNQSTRDILFRWYLTQQPSTYPDQYGFPIYPTYAPFYERRPIAFPKQIKWSNNQPIGQLQFEVYGQSGQNSILLNTLGYDWGMTLLVSEV
jgi:hypothetical protein